MAPSSHRSGQRPRLAKVLNRTQTSLCSSAGSQPAPFAFDAWSSMAPPVVTEPDMEHIAQAIITKLLSDPHSGLPASFNSLVMRAIEALTKLKLETARVRAELDEAQQAKKLLDLKLQKQTADWVLRELDYEAEIQRLRDRLSPRTKMFETPRIFKKKRAVAPLPFRRHSGSSPPRQTVYEFLQDSSPAPSTLKPAKMIPRPPAKPSTPLSARNLTAEADANSAFSSEADTLSDKASETPDVTADQDFASIRRLAEIMVCRRGVELDHALGRLSAAFFGEGSDSPVITRPPKKVSTISDLDENSPATTTGLMMSRSRSPLPCARQSQRVFSFHPGDDASFQSRLLSTLNKQEENQQPPGCPSSASSADERTYSRTDSVEDPLCDRRKKPLLAGDRQKSNSPSQSPSLRGAALNDVRSRIPSPAYGGSTVGRPRPRRETTSSSVSTAIRRSPLDASSPVFRGSHRAHNSRGTDSTRSSK